MKNFTIAVLLLLCGLVATAVGKPLPKMPREPPAEVRRDAFNGDNSGLAHIYRVIFSPDGRYFLAAGDAGGRSPVRVYHGRTGQLVCRFLPNEDVGWTGGRFSPDGKKVVSWGTGSAAVYVWEADTARQLLKLTGHKEEVIFAAFSPDGQRIVSGGKDGCLRVWDVATGKVLLNLKGHAGACAGYFSPDGKWLVSCGDDSTVRGWNAATGQEAWQQSEQRANNFWYYTDPFAPDGTRVFSLASDGSVRIWETATGKSLAKLAAPAESQDARFLPDGRRLVSWTKDKKLHVWDLASGKELHGFDLGADLRHEPDNVAVSPDGRLVLTGHANQTVRVRELASGKELCSFEIARQLGTRSLAFAPDSRYAAAGSFRGWVYMWRLP